MESMFIEIKHINDSTNLNYDNKDKSKFKVIHG